MTAPDAGQDHDRRRQRRRRPRRFCVQLCTDLYRTARKNAPPGPGRCALPRTEREALPATLRNVANYASCRSSLATERDMRSKIGPSGLCSVTESVHIVSIHELPPPLVVTLRDCRLGDD